jgi:lysophospholipase L1-like esterase
MIKKIALALSVLLSGPVSAQSEVRILAFGDSNTWGWIPAATGFPTSRYSDAVRWPGVLEAELRKTIPGATVVVDALSGRTVNTAYPEAQNAIEGGEFKGLSRIGSAVAAALPLDLVIIMLGTNDARSDLAVPTANVARDITAMVERVKTINGGVATDYPTPKVLVVAPPAMGDTSRTPISGVTQGSDKLSAAISAAIVAASRATGTPVFDAGRAVQVKSIDGVHFSPENHRELGRVLTSEVKNVLGK